MANYITIPDTMIAIYEKFREILDSIYGLLLSKLALRQGLRIIDPAS